MLTESNTQTKKFEISTIQKVLFNILLFMLPWFIIPLPWDLTERGKSLLFVGITVIIMLLEVIKWVWDGKVTILRSTLDGAVLLVLISLLLSTVLARDTWVATWGFDGKLGAGMFVGVFLFGMFYLFRDFLSEKATLLKSIESFLWGIMVLTILSLLSFFKIDIFSFIPVYKDLLTVGFPLTFAFKSMIIVSGASIFLSLFLILTYIKSKQYFRLWYVVLMLVISFVSFILFSINQGVLIPLIFSLSLLFVAILFMFKLGKKERYVPITIATLSVLALALSVGIQIPSFRNAVLGEKFEVLTPLTLGDNLSWQVSTKAITSDAITGIFGLGNESFPIAYSSAKPLTTDTLSLGNITFSNASSEVLTLLATRGIFGVGVWILLGIAIIKLVIKDIEENKDSENIIYLIPEILTIFLFLVSFAAPFMIIVNFVFFVSLLLTVVVRSLPKANKEYFVIKFWAMDIGEINKNLNKSVQSINWFLTAVFIIIAGIVVIKVLGMTISTMYLLKAESYSNQENLKFAEQEPTIEEREEFLNDFLLYYDKAMSYESNNTLLQRKAGLISLESLNLLSERYSDASEEDKKTILSNVSAWKNMAIEFSRESINISPYTYANWNARATIYMGLVGVGLSDYSEDAISALQRSIELNPLDYNSYYQIGQVYMVTEEYDKSVGAFNQALSINGQHVPSLVFAAQILSQQKDVKSARSYLEAAQKILETNEQKETDLYKNVVESLAKLGTDTPPTEEAPSGTSEE